MNDQQYEKVKQILLVKLNQFRESVNKGEQPELTAIGNEEFDAAEGGWGRAFAEYLAASFEVI